MESGLDENRLQILKTILTARQYGWVSNLKTLPDSVSVAIDNYEKSLSLACTTPEQLELLHVLCPTAPESNRVRDAKKSLKETVNSLMKREHSDGASKIAQQERA